MRPVVPDGGAPWSVFYRVRTRPEAGEDQGGRRYLMARYTVAPDDDVSPLALLEVLDGDRTRLRGVTREEAAALDALSVSDAEPDLSRAGETFCRGALFYVLSGIPVSVTEDVEEQEFFSWVAALWELLPPDLRVHLSAGWGVGNSFSGHLAVTHTALRSPECALFSPSELAWTPPAYKTVREEDLFFEEDQELGAYYVGFLFDEDGGYFDAEGEWPVRPAPVLTEEKREFLRLPAFSFPELPDWHDQVVMDAFRYPGLKVRDRDTYRDIRDWLKTGQYEDEVLPLLDVGRSLTFESTRKQTLCLMMGAMAEDDSRPRADRGIWVALSKNRSAPLYHRIEPLLSYINEVDVPWSSRARLLAALRGGNTLDVLRRLTLTTDAKRREADGLLQEVTEILRGCLDDSVKGAMDDAMFKHAPGGNEYLLRHAELLQLQTPPAAYSDWLDGEGLRLMRVFVSWREDFGDVPPQDIVRVSPGPDREALWGMLLGVEDPRAALSAAGLMTAEQYRAFAEAFTLEWARADAARRQYLLGWFDALGLLSWYHKHGRLEGLDPLLLLHADVPLSQREQFDSVVREVEGVRVPLSLEKLAAAACLAYAEHILDRIWLASAGQNAGLMLMMRQWPQRDTEALGVRPSNRLPVPPEVERASRELMFSPAGLNEVLRRVENGTRRASAGHYWEWAERYWQTHQGYRPDESFQPGAMELCWYLWHSSLPPGTPTPLSRQEVERAAELVRDSGFAEALRGRAQEFWREAAEGDAWRLMLLLLLFPQEGLNPSPMQLIGLATYYDWLAEHLRQWPWRREAFEVASVPFHTLSYKGDMGRWSDAFRQSPIWAAFRGVPDVQRLPTGALERALQHYCRIGEATLADHRAFLVREAKSRMCRDFVRAYERLPSFDPAIVRVLREFVIPELASRHGESQVENIFQAFFAVLKEDRRKNAPSVPQEIDGEFYDLIQYVVRNTSEGTIWRAARHHLFNV